MRPLEGITVVTLEHAVAAPFATRQLADLGARVIKVERPGSGDFARQYDQSVNGLASYFVWLNRSKESVAIDLKKPAGLEAVGELVRHADVVVQNLGPGAATRLGLDPTQLAEKHPSLVTCRISGWGTDGPWADRKAYDLLVQCETGLLSMTGSPGEPAKVGISVADIAAGMYGFSGTLAALYRRQATGEGSAVEVSLFEALAEWMGQPAHFTDGAGRQPGRFGAQHATITPYGPFTTGDGRTVLMSIQNEDEWGRFCETFLNDPGLSSDERFTPNSARVRHREELNKLIADRFAQLDSETAVGLLNEARIANAGVNTVAEFLEHPVLTERDRWRDIDTPAGSIRAMLPPIGMTGFTPRMDAVPALGEHTEPVLAELGYSRSDITSISGSETN